eukprot:CAMPEP_0179870340 /NCGR_PEP_ID=MMETSP0982-20121206/20157_1 /TAXON_ID=483367 /ORGANISM="non described non described, Strain CCMP 2436" /LENGTH=42 /DNA_ID= /DNA_START= /DNA_END= /DNA_ORIENTATION=
MKGGSGGGVTNYQVDLSTPTQALTQYPKVGNMVEVGDDEEAE